MQQKLLENHSLRKIPPPDFLSSKRVCRNFVIKDCKYQRCRNGKHDRSLKANYDEHKTSLIDTKEHTEHHLDFYCRICHNLLVRREYISRIHKNAIWCTQVDNSWDSNDKKFHPIKSNKLGKKVYISPVFCICGNWIGDRYHGYQSPNGMSVEYKLEYVGRNGKNTPMYFEGSQDQHTPFEEATPHPITWNNEKKDVEDKFSLELGINKEEMLSPVTMIVSKLVEMSLDKEQLEKKLKVNEKENEELKQLTAECPICLSGKPDVALECGHVSHQECIQQLRKRGNYKCSLCNKQVKQESDRKLYF